MRVGQLSLLSSLLNLRLLHLRLQLGQINVLSRALLNRLRLALLLGCNEGRGSLLVPLVRLLSLLLPLLPPLVIQSLLLVEEVLARFQLQIHLGRHLSGREGRVFSLRLPSCSLLLLRVTSRCRRLHLLLELGEESLPTLVLQLLILHQFPLDHHRLDVVDGMDVVHAVRHDRRDLLESREGSNCSHGASLDAHVALREQLDGLQCGAIVADETSSTLDESLLVRHHGRDLDDLTADVVLQRTNRLLVRYGTGHQLEHTTNLDDNVRVPCLSRGPNGHGSLKQIEFSLEVVVAERLLNKRPTLPAIATSVLREEDGEGRLRYETILVVYLAEGGDVPPRRILLCAEACSGVRASRLFLVFLAFVEIRGFVL
ncbi:hypothetical protein PFISCL1PPCAC_2608, partial [Pristionchus fissidentatus]